MTKISFSIEEKALNLMVDLELFCDYCPYTFDCPKGARCYGGNPVFPPCAEGSVDFDIDSFIEDYPEYFDGNLI